MKTIKFASKRLKLTKTGKVLFRPAKQNHFNAKESGSHTRGKRGLKSLSKSQTKIFKKILSY
jgi:ribosomal protein L35